MKNYILGTAIAGSLLAQLYTHAEVSEELYILDDFIVSAGPNLRSVSDFAAPIDILEASDLAKKSATNFGNLLEGSLGISSTSYTAGASRPVVRGFSGPRVSILDGGLNTLDASDTSPDHAVAVEPMLVDRVEVLRGPSVLLYGGSSIGGAINVIDKSILRAPLTELDPIGSFEYKTDSVSDGTSHVGYVGWSNSDWGLRFTVANKNHDNYDVPDHLNDEGEPEEKLDGSYLNSNYNSIGITRFFDADHYLAVSVSELASVYGIPGHHHHEEEEGEEEHEEEGVFIDLDTRRYKAEYSLKNPTDWADALRIQGKYTDYTHAEIEDGAPATTYNVDGWEVRGEVAHNQMGGIDTGLWGFQLSNKNYEAVGEESLTPKSNTKKTALFLNEHWHGDHLHYEAGARLEKAKIAPDSDALDYSGNAVSLSASAIWNLSPTNSLKVSINRNQRHPTASELYTNGPHLATESFEIGDEALGKETLTGIDLIYTLEGLNSKTTITSFYSKIDDFIYLSSLGYQTDDEGAVTGDPGFEAEHALDTYQNVATDANFYGLEAEYTRLLGNFANGTISYRILADLVRAKDTSTSGNLPRIPPVRLGLSLDYDSPTLQAGLIAKKAMKQTRNASFEEATPGYTKLDAYLSKQIALARGQSIRLFANASNLLNEKIVHHASYLKDEAPSPGRNITLGLRLDF